MALRDGRATQEARSTQPEIMIFLVDAVSRLAEIDRDQVDVNCAFANYGLDSAQILQLTGELSELIGRDLSESLAWEYPTILQLSAHLAGNLTDANVLAEFDLEQ